jgi:hyaluronoglucosaminidase
MTAPLGTIEGYYGTPWNWEDREHVIGFLAAHDYRFYIYAPKADRFLRKRWREEHPREMSERLSVLAARCRSLDVRFGVGLSPFEIYRNFDDTARSDLKRKLAWLDSIGAEILAVLFDDMRGDLPELAVTQARILHWIQEHTGARQLIVCPSYYTDDPVLDRFFGQRPQNYLEELGAALDPSIDVFWTGEEVCAREIGVAHVKRVGEQLRRKPFLWDNYPVNDGPRMSPFLHVRAFTGRSASLAPHVAAHAVNPALQAHLSLIPMLTLANSYRVRDGYAYGRAFDEAARLVLGERFANLLREDLTFLQDVGLERLGTWRQSLKERYANIDHPAAREILGWLDGVYRVTEMRE